MAFKSNSEQYKRKMKALRSAVEFFEEAPLDAITYLQEGLVTGVINGQYRGVISGNLKRSMEILRTTRFSAALVSDLGIAPYSIDMRELTQKQYGSDFYQITERVYGHELRRSLLASWRILLKKIEKGEKYTYKSQLPVI